MNLTSELLTSLREKKVRSVSRRSLLAFTEYFSDEITPRWEAGKIHREICAQLDRVINREIDRLLLLCPPQHGKSLITSKRFPAYVLGRDPSLDVIAASATAELAEGFGRDVRNCVQSPSYRNLYPETELAEDSQARGRWNTKQGGSYYAVGIGGALFGRGGMAIIDDPFASWDDAQSETTRDKVWDWYTGTLYNRVRPGQPIIVIQHRMHEDDLAGRLIEAQKAGGDQWTIVNLPALLEDPPWPERYDRGALERIKANTSPLQWSALYQQNPIPPEGTFFQRKWFRRYHKAELPTVHYYASSDHAPGGTEVNDFNCFRIWGIDASGDLHLVDGFREQATMDNFTDKAMPMLKRYKPFCWFPEDDNNWKAIAGFVTKIMREQKVYCRIEPISPRGSDKAAKAQPFQAMASMGRVWLPHGSEGDDVLMQYLQFPGGKHDDEVDAAGTIGRALDQAHPAIVKTIAPKKVKDRWTGDEDEQQEANWRTA